MSHTCASSARVSAARIVAQAPRSGRTWLAACAAIAFSFAAMAQAAATTIERVVSPAGIELWLVREPSIPLIAMDFAFRGGSAQDPADKMGVAHMMAGLLDEGAGDIESRSFHERLEAKAIEMNFGATRDYVSGSLRTLTENSGEAFDLLRLALNAPRFDAEDVERIRVQLLSSLRRETQSPNDIASKRWWATAFPNHPYGRPSRGTLDSVTSLTADDMRAFTKKTFARDGLKVAMVGDVDAAAAGALVDKVFAGLPKSGDLTPVPQVELQGGGQSLAIDLDVAQSVVLLGGEGIPRHDKDFMAAFVVNHILGGGSFSSRLYKEIREVRGLAYSVYSTVLPLDRAALFMASTATRADRAPQAVTVLEQEIRRMAENGPTEEEFTKAKSFLTGSFALRFDTSGKIASQLVQLQLENMGIDYINVRNDLVEAVTLADTQRVAKRLLEGKNLVVVVGRPQPIATSTDATKGGG